MGVCDLGVAFGLGDQALAHPMLEGPNRGGDDQQLNYGTNYHFNGWTVEGSSDGTRFTNDGTGHGMFVSIQNVYSF